MWCGLTQGQREELLKEDYRARIYAAGVEVGARNARGRLLEVLEHVADYMDLWAVDPAPTPLPGSLEELAAEVMGALASHLRGLLRQHPECKDVFVNVGSAYRSVLVAVLVDLTEYCRENGIRVTMASGGIGTRLAQMKAWLEGGPGGRARTGTDMGE